MAVAEPTARHGRCEERTLWALTDPALTADGGSAGTRGEAWPHLAQVCRLDRQRVNCRTGEIEGKVTYLVTSLPPARADATTLLALVRGHWGIENRLHWVRDVTFDEDRCQIRSGAAPQAVAACRNLVLALARRAGATNVAATLRTYAGRPTSAIQVVLTGGMP